MGKKLINMNKTLKVGDWIRSNKPGHNKLTGLLCLTAFRHVTLMILLGQSGVKFPNRWGEDSIKVEDVLRITKEEIEKMLLCFSTYTLEDFEVRLQGTKRYLRLDKYFASGEEK